RAAIGIFSFPIFEASTGQVVCIALFEPGVGIVTVIAGIIEQRGKGEMDPAALRVLSRAVTVGALPVVKDPERIPIAPALRENSRIVDVIALTVAEQADAAIGADAGAPWPQTEAEALRHGDVRAVWPAVVRIFPSGTIRIIPGAFEQHAKAVRIGKPLRIHVGHIMVGTGMIVKQPNAEHGRALRAPMGSIDIVAAKIGEHSDTQAPGALRPS